MNAGFAIRKSRVQIPPGPLQYYLDSFRVNYDEWLRYRGSKATISECVNESKAAWQLFQQDIEQQKQIEDEARKQLIEGAKQRMKEQEQPNERTAVLHSGECNTP